VGEEIMNFEQAINELRDTLIVVAEIQRRQSEVQKTQAEEIELSRQRMARVELALAEIGDKLNGLIGYIDGQRKQ
jgi:hypothetical protein